MFNSQKLLKVSKEVESKGCDIWVVGRWTETSAYQVTSQTDRTRLEILRQYAPPKRRYLSMRLHNVTFQKTVTTINKQINSPLFVNEYGKGRGESKGKVHFRTGHKSPEGSRSITLPFL